MLIVERSAHTISLFIVNLCSKFYCYNQPRSFHCYSAIHSFCVIFFVAALYTVGGLLSIVCWTDYRRIFELKQLCSSPNNICSCFLFQNLFSGSSEAQVPQRSSARQRIFFKWRLLRNSDFLILTAAHIAANVAEVIPDIYFTEKNFPNESAICGIVSLCVGLVADCCWRAVWLIATAACALRSTYLMAGGLWCSALLVAPMPTLIVYTSTDLRTARLREGRPFGALLRVYRECRLHRGLCAGSGNLVGSEWPHIFRGRRARRMARIRKLWRDVPHVWRTRATWSTHVPVREHRAPNDHCTSSTD